MYLLFFLHKPIDSLEFITIVGSGRIQDSFEADTLINQENNKKILDFRVY